MQRGSRVSAPALVTVVVSELILAGAAASAAPAGSPWTIVASHAPVPAERGRVVDVRWDGDGTATLLAVPSGLYTHVEVGKTLTMEAPRAQPGQPGMAARASRLAADGRWWATAGMIGELCWTDASRRDFGRRAFGAINDVDVGGGRVAVVGCSSDDRNRWAEDGGVIFLGRLDRALTDLRPLLLTPERGGGAASVRCGMMALGRVRFLADGSLAAYPGVVPGLFLYDADGNLQRVVDTSPLGLDTSCDVRGQAVETALRNLRFRYAWLNRRVTVDEILPLPDGPALLLRRHDGGVTRWELAVLEHGGSFRREALPVEVASPFAMASGDARHGTLLLAVVVAAGGDGSAAEPSRLYLLKRR